MSRRLTYLVTLSRAHVTPARLLVETLHAVTDAEIVVVGNLEGRAARAFGRLGVRYIDENDVDLTGRLPAIAWETKYREVGWYRQMLLRLSIDRFLGSEQVVILDSEVFAFASWDESRFYDPESGRPRCFYWVPSTRKPVMDYRMYRGAAFLLSFLADCGQVMEYADSDHFRRHISGVVLFSTGNVAAMWRRLERETDLEGNLDRLFNREPDLAFSDHDMYGIAVEQGLFEDVVPTVLHNDLLGWYDNHDDPAFHRFKEGAMWSMCQRYFDHPDEPSYRAYATTVATALGARLAEPAGRGRRRRGLRGRRPESRLRRLPWR